MLVGTKTLNLEPIHSPYAYQLHAVEAVKDLEYAALFHEQGLGKTKIALDLALLWLKGSVLDTVLIITKKGLVKNWEKEVASHTNLHYAVLGTNRVQNSKKFNKPYRLYLAHYEAVSASQKSFALLLKTRRVGVILDEAHHMKNPEGRVAQSLFEISPLFKRRVIMTGTPVANRPYDIWSQVYFLDGGSSLGRDYQKFKADYDIPKDAIERRDTEFEDGLHSLYEAIQPFTIRETKDSAGLKLPQKHIVNQWVNMEGKQAELYQQCKHQLYIEISRDGRIVLDDVEHILKQMLRLVQIASNPLLVDQAYDQIPCKEEALVKILENVKADEKAIIWTNFIDNADYIAKKLESMGSIKLHGKMNMEARNRSVDRFIMDPSKRFLVATPGAAKEGLTLTVANHAIFFDRNFSLNDWLQAQDRIHRISQAKECKVVHLLANDSIDEWIDKLLLCKKHLAAIAQGDEAKSSKIRCDYAQEVKEIVEGAIKL